MGAWVSQQSRPLESRFELEKRVALFAAKHAIGKVPRPPYWSGFRLTPRLIEFWQDGAFRLHDRLVYTCAAEGRSEEHTSELQSLMRISYAVFCLTKKNNFISVTTPHYNFTT